MGKKKKKRAAFSNRREGVFSENDSFYNTPRCVHPEKIKIGEHEVVLMGWMRYHPKESYQLLAGLDVFLGLDLQWAREMQDANKYSNPFFQRLVDKFLKRDEDKLDNILLAVIPDRGTREAVFELARFLLLKDKKVGFGCSGGHGRTGWLAARLVKEFEGVDGDEAVRRVRERYCVEAVESNVQADDLGCVKVTGADKVAQGFLYGKREMVTPLNFSGSSIPLVKERREAEKDKGDGAIKSVSRGPWDDDWFLKYGD